MAEAEFGCPAEVPVAVLGGKWEVLILWHLLRADRRTGELRRLLPGISQKMLTQQLRQLEADGLVARTASADVPPTVTYAVVAEERAGVEQVVLTLCGWGRGWDERHGRAVALLAADR